MVRRAHVEGCRVVRWGNWYRHDGCTLKLVTNGLLCTGLELTTPATVCEFVDANRDQLTVDDVVSLMAAANALAWHAFDFDGIGDWIDDTGMQRGRAMGVVA